MTPTPVDALLHVNAHVSFAATKARELIERPPVPLTPEQLVGVLLHQLESMQALVAQHVEVHAPGQNAYSAGHAVMSHVDLEPGGSSCVVYIWNPDPASPVNQPRVIHDAWLADGSRRRVFISAPGVIDVAPLPEG